MHTLLKTIPIPLSGLMLGVAALAKLFFLMGLTLPANTLFVIGISFFILLLMKGVCTFGDVLRDLQNPVIASVAPTFTMGTMVLSSMLLLENIFVTAAHIVWLLAVVFHFVLIGFFLKTHFKNITLLSVFPSWFVTFVGISMIPATAPAFALPYTTGIVYVALIAFIILLPFVLTRVFVLRDLPEGARPLITILAAPASLCLVAYMAVFHETSTVLLIIAQLLYVVVLLQLPKLLTLPFYTSYGAFTFPLVVSATALYNAAPNLHVLIYIETALATVIVLYVVVHYVKFLMMSYQQNAAFQQSNTAK